MIAIWMVYCVVLALVLSAAALLGERAARALGYESRRVWAAALGGAVVLPLVGVVLRSADMPEEALFADQGAAVSPVLAMLVESVDALSLLDGPLLTLWMVASATVLMGLTTLAWHTRRRIARLPRAHVDGAEVRVSNDVGPAVVGLVRGSIVLPRWALEGGPEERRMMLRHEEEHIRGGDPHLFLYALLLLVLMPWNPALWYMATRLRLAIEVDCDDRVLRSGELDVRRYGTLLLTVGRMRSRNVFPAAAFARSRSVLEHRIDEMTRRAVASPTRWRPAGLAAAACLLLMGAWWLPQPVRAADSSLVLGPCPEELKAQAQAPDDAGRASPHLVG